MNSKVNFFCLGVIIGVGNLFAANTIMPATEIYKLNSCNFTNFNTKSLPSSCGLDVDVYYPQCMSFEKGGYQTHTIGKASYEWNDFEVLVQISVAAEDCGKSKVKNLKKTIPDMNRDDIGELATVNGGKFLDGGIVNIRDIKVLWFETLNNVNRMGESSLLVMRQYIIPADSGKMFYLRFSVGSANGQSPRNDFNALKPMFQRCAVALTLKQYDQFYKPSPGWKFW